VCARKVNYALRECWFDGHIDDGDAVDPARIAYEGQTRFVEAVDALRDVQVMLKVVGSRAVGFQMPAGVTSFLPGFPSDAPIDGGAPYAPLVITMPRGEELAAAVSARATGEQRS